MFKYKLFKNAVEKNLTNFLYNYLILKKEDIIYLFENNLVPYEETFGSFRDPQAPNTYSVYSDLAMETLLQEMTETISSSINKNIIPSYSYARLYKKGDELKKHTDRPSCELSGSINLGGDSWPLFVDNKKFNLNPGDMLIYNGCDLEHWREPFDGDICAQVFLHYVFANGKYEHNKFDQRKKLGIPFNY